MTAESEQTQVDLDSECFFIAPIGDEGSDVRRRSDGVMNFIVAKAAKELGLVTVRADKIAHPGQINIQVINHVLGARAAVVDLTGLNPNVFYEMAVRHTAKLPLVIIAEKGTKLPFDIAQMRTVFFTHTDLEDADKCREAIVSQLREALERGIVDSPVSTSIDVQAMQSGSAIERSVADLVTTVQDLSMAQARMYSMLRHSDGPRDGMRVPTAAIREILSAHRSLVELSEHRDDDGGLHEVIGEFERPVRYLARRRVDEFARHRTEREVGPTLVDVDGDDES